MVPHSLQYLAFVSGAVLVYYSLPWRTRWVPLLAASSAFYLSWGVEFACVLLALTTGQYFLAHRVDKARTRQTRRAYLLTSVALGLGLLIYFKYATALRLDLGEVVAGITGRSKDASVALLAPIGISFYTLQTMGYMLDVYHGRRRAEPHFGIFAVFVCFFPIVVSGPIERAAHLLPQLQPGQRIAVAYDNISQGVKLIIWGLFLKLVIADRAALYVNAVFGNPARHSGVTFVVATVFYSFQIYCDFAGYSSVAIGSAKLLGVDILQNFHRPYLAVSVKEFWRRWHITLSNWLRDYVFLPFAYALSRRMSSERYGPLRVDTILYAAAIFPTFVLCGLWHGPNTTFLVWGCLHGLYLAVENNFRIRPRWRLVHIARTYGLILVSWIFFRADSVASALGILKKVVTDPGRLFIPAGPDVVAPLYAAGGIAILVIIELKREFYHGGISVFGHRNEYVRLMAYGLLVALIISVGVFDGGQFIYAQF